jgi:hypothetical protein
LKGCTCPLIALTTSPLLPASTVTPMRLFLLDGLSSYGQSMPSKNILKGGVTGWQTAYHELSSGNLSVLQMSRWRSSMRLYRIMAQTTGSREIIQVLLRTCYNAWTSEKQGREMINLKAWHHWQTELLLLAFMLLQSDNSHGANLSSIAIYTSIAGFSKLLRT